MNSSNAWNTISRIFTGKGGTARLGMLLIGALVVAGEIVENNYEIGGETSNGGKFNVKPSSHAPESPQGEQHDSYEGSNNEMEEPPEFDYWESEENE